MVPERQVTLVAADATASNIYFRKRTGLRNNEM